MTIKPKPTALEALQTIDPGRARLASNLAPLAALHSSESLHSYGLLDDEGGATPELVAALMIATGKEFSDLFALV
ncbi:hypothetical protein Back2_18190 [Nocardioides baekrokdamisoli]|uniref:Uncharacterized protein n=1 Tax=Nocardioides baekrokdamisoli TaxID=1804624 RepID=A0A3G9IH54_9ACTN|nr:hypothetical protein [Nocardioides baekrokdamisoli]BBH17532.1 hypothetical protein Back2_18190 [Nocardioides baekrokdamisoli]